MGAPTTPCDGCDARCCSAYSVHLTGDDVVRLAAGTERPAHAFVTCAEQASRSATGFLLRPGGPSHDLLLAHARAAGPRPPCPFLRAGGGGGGPPRCGVYPFRPRACRRFPAARRAGGFGVRDGILCPSGAWAGADMARLSWRVALAREDREVETYAAVVTAWNARVARAPRRAPTVVDYLDWLADAYRWLVPWRAALRPARRTGAAYLDGIRETLGSCPPA